MKAHQRIVSDLQSCRNPFNQVTSKKFDQYGNLLGHGKGRNPFNQVTSKKSAGTRSNWRPTQGVVIPLIRSQVKNQRKIDNLTISEAES